MHKPVPASFDAFADYYDAADLDRELAIAFYQTLPDSETGSMLDIGCGTGTITIPVAERMRAGRPEARVVGVDLSARMLEQARRREPSLDWVLGDMRSPPVQGPFDLILCCYHTFQVIETHAGLLEVLSRLRSLATPGGRLAFDVYQPNFAYLRAQTTERVVRQFIAADGRRLELRETLWFEEDSQVLVGDWVLHDRDAPEAWPVTAMRSRSRQYLASEIESLLAASGWRLAERYGFYDRSPFTPASKKQVVIAVAD